MSLTVFCCVAALPSCMHSLVQGCCNSVIQLVLGACIGVAVLQAPVDAPERFFVEIQFSNGANYDPTLVEPPRHTMPTQPRRLLTNLPGVPLQTFQVCVLTVSCVAECLVCAEQGFMGGL